MAQVPAGFEFTPTPQSGTFYGQAELDGVPCPAGSWVGAFDEDGHCAGAAELVAFDGAAYINLIVYGDDATTADIDEAGGFYYNGPATIQAKTRFAQDAGLGGMMIWELAHDARGDDALLQAMGKAIR